MARLINNDKKNTAASDKDASWKSDGFINIRIKDSKGNMRQIGAISLRDADPAQKAVREWLKADPAKTEARLVKLFTGMELSYRDAADANPVVFALPED